MLIHLYTVTLVLDSPSAVSAPEARTAGSALTASLPVARDGNNLPYVPAASLAGSLRAHAGPQAPLLFGELRQEPDPDGRGQTRTVAVASAVRLLGTRTDLPIGTPEPLVRRRTAIDRHSGAAAAATLHARELLPPGTTVTAWLRLDGEAENAAALEALLASWQPRIGSGRTTGHGRATIRRITRRVLDLSTPAGRRHWLTQGGPQLFDGGSVILEGAATQPERRVLDHDLGFTVADALHVASGTAEHTGHRSTDRARHLRDHADRPLLPGSAWKGLLRSRCEFILRSLDQPACAGTPGCGSCRVCAAFGHAAAKGGESAGLRGRLVFLDSPVLGPDGRSASTVHRNHVAIDRFTGGAHAGTLFTQEVVEDGHLVLTILDEPADPDAEPLDPVLRDVLLLALHDVHTGALGVGGGTTRGYGTLRADARTAAYLETEAEAARDRLGHLLEATP